MKRILPTILLTLLVLCARAHAADPVCFQCHADEAKDWKASIHAKNGISCTSCHGGNAKDVETAMDPKFGFVGKPSEAQIPTFCGKCHVGVKDNYLKSPHDAALTRGGPSCITCHTAHKQQRANINLIAPGLCGSCHSFERAEKIKNSMLMSESEITNLEERIDALRIQGYDVDAEQKSLFAVRNKFHRLSHVVDVALILKDTTGIQSEIGHIKEDISSSEKTEVRRKIYGSGLIVFLILAALMFWWYRNTELEG